MNNLLSTIQSEQGLVMELNTYLDGLTVKEYKELTRKFRENLNITPSRLSHWRNGRAKPAEFLKKVQVKMMADMISLYDANQELKKDFDSFSEAVEKDLEIINGLLVLAL